MVYRVIRELPAYHLRDGYLIVKACDLALGLSRLRHIHRGGGIDIGHLMFGFVRRYVGVDIAELFFDDTESFVDKARGRYGDLIFVGDPMFVVDLDQCAEYIVGLADGGARDGDFDDRGFIGWYQCHDLC